MKFPTDNDPAGDSSSNSELDELQRMVKENEDALKRANRMISDLRKKLSPPRGGKSAANKTRKK